MTATPKLKTRVRREQIVEAALESIAEHGIEGLSMAEVAERVGLVPSALYRHFAGKEEIFEACLAHLRQRLMGNLILAADENEGAIEQLRSVLMRHIDLVLANPAAPRIIFSSQGIDGPPERRALMQAMINGYLAGIEGIVAAGKSSGEIRSDVEPDVAAMLVFGIFQPAAFRWHVSDGKYDMKRQAERAWKHFERMLRA